MSKSKLERANQLLEQNRPDEALQLFREHLKTHTPELGEICNMGVAEQQANIAFAKEVYETHPGCFDAAVMKVNAFYHGGYRVHAFQFITEYLKCFTNELDQLKLKRWRFGISEKAGQYDFFASDLQDVWSQIPKGVLFRKGLMRDIGAFESPESLPALEEVLDADWIEHDLRQLIVLKVQLLHHLKIATDNHDRLHPRPGLIRRSITP